MSTVRSWPPADGRKRRLPARSGLSCMNWHDGRFLDAGALRQLWRLQKFEHLSAAVIRANLSMCACIPFYFSSRLGLTLQSARRNGTHLRQFASRIDSFPGNCCQSRRLPPSLPLPPP